MTPKDLDLSLPIRPMPPILTTWYDHLRSQNWYRLSRDNNYVEAHITDEQLEDAPRTWELVHDVIAVLCAKWHMRFGERLIPEPPSGEAEPWSVRYDNVIEGEVIIKEIEGGKTDATRGCIEGR